MIKIKKSQAHLEIVISFVIFVGFLIVILFFINPFKTTTQSYASLDELQNNILANISNNYQSVSLILKADPSGNCFAINDTLLSNENLLAFDSAGGLISADRQFGRIYLDISNIPSGVDKRYYRLFLSDYFMNVSFNPVSCTPLNEGDYSLGVLGFETSVSHTALANFNKSYIQNYNNLRNFLGTTKDFDFVVYDLQKKILFNESLSKHSIIMGNIFARDIPLSLINSTGYKQQIILNLRVWG
jgi:hypothetical protein